MITAKGAQEQFDRHAAEVKIAKSKIITAVDNCKHECLLGIPISVETQNWLESLDYDVMVSEDNTLVKW